MKKATLVIAGLFAMSSSFAQKSVSKQESGFVQCSEFHETRPLREIFENSTDEPKAFVESEVEDRDGNIPQKFPLTVEKDGPAYGNDPSTIQTIMGGLQNRTPLQSWAGQAATGFYPLDPSGAVGPNHYVQMINSTTFKIWNKTGTALLTGTLGNLWSPVTANAGDPVVLYDKAANRFLMAQFGNPANIYIAISKTADPTGAWYTYTFTSPVFPDYLKFSVWQDGYYMCSNAQTRVFAFERAKMLVGDATAKSVYASYTQSGTSGFFCPLPADAGDGTLPATGTKLPFFAYTDNAWGGANTDAVKVWNTTVTWGTTPTMTTTLNATLATAAFDASYSSAWNDVSQPGTTQMLDGIGGVCMFRAQYKIWSTYNSVVLNWAVKISATQRSIKWVELRQNSSGVWSLYQEGIYAPDANTRWMGSIAMDNNGGIALCYMKSNSSSIYPGLYYTGRKACDPLGTMTIAETQVVAGTASQTGVNRDGDYAQTTLDPDGVTFWHTGMFMGAGGAQKTQIYSFILPQCAATAAPVANFSATQTTICAGQSVTFTDLSTNVPASWAWTFAGGTPTTATTQYPSVTFSTPGTYAVTLTATNSFGSNTVTQTNYITVNASPATPNATSNSPLCNGQTINLSTATLAGATYSWTGPVGFTSTLQNPTRPASIALAGTYSVVVTAGGCPSLAGTVTVTINANPSTPTITAAGNTLTSSSTTGNQWYLNGTAISGATGVTYNATQPGVYTVKVTSTGCTSAASNSITITGIEQYFQDNSFSIYPNPSNGKFIVTFHTDTKKAYTLKLVNDLGQLIYSRELNDFSGDYNQPIDISSYGKGVYMFILVENKNETVRKVIVY